MLATPHIAATCVRAHRTNQLLYDKELTPRQSMHIDATVALTGRNTCNDTRNLTLGIIKSELRCIDSTTKTYDHTYKLDSPTLKKDSDIYPYDYVHYSYVEMYKHRRRSTGVPPRTVKHIGYQPSISVNVNPIKEHETYVNFKFIEEHAISVPPRKNHAKPTPKWHTTYKPLIIPRNNYSKTWILLECSINCT